MEPFWSDQLPPPALAHCTSGLVRKESPKKTHSGGAVGGRGTTSPSGLQPIFQPQPSPTLHGTAAPWAPWTLPRVLFKQTSGRQLWASEMSLQLGQEPLG